MTNDVSILIIDDEQDLCSILTVVLEKEHYAVDCAFTLHDASRKLNLAHPEIILLDNNLPDGCGLAFLHDNRRLFDFSSVIVITADIGPATRLRAAAEGITHYVQKPFTLGKIKELLAQVA